MIGKTVSNYNIVEKLGEGGMGVVYRAEDARLKRPVALKFLPTHYTGSPDVVERFEREAQSAAALNHPNIITIYEIGEFEGHIYIAMEYVPGHELRELIAPGLSLARSLEIAVQVADGLNAAHESGIIHRDIKPENILVNDKGRVKILDFGLAKLHGVTRITQEASTVGTLHYMSPEQMRGEDVDHRSDIFSFGAVLYEMITGAAAFPGDNAAAVTSAVTNTTPQPLVRFNRNAGDELERIVSKCLEKDPAQRYQHMSDLLVDLRKVAGITVSATPSPGSSSQRPVAGAASTGLGGRGMGRWIRWMVPLVVAIAVVAVWQFAGRSPGGDQTTTVTRTAAPATATDEKTKIAVLPFQNLGAADDEYFADGMTEEITSRLAAVGGLGVISRTSAMQYKGSKKSLQEIGAELDVDYVLEGTVRWSRSGEQSRVRITPQLITVSDDTHLWSNRYDRTLEDIFEVQSEIAQSIVQELDVSLLEAERQQIDDRPTESMPAYQAYLRARDLWRNIQFLENEIAEVIDALDDAIRYDPEFVEALRWLSVAHSAMVHFGYDRTEQRMALAKGYAERCMELAPDEYTGYHALGNYYYWCRRDYDNALKALDKASELQPNNDDVLETRAYTKRRMGRLRDTIDDLRKSIELDPLDTSALQEVGDTYMCLREFDEAERYFRRAVELSQNNALQSYYLMMLMFARGDLDAARAVVESMPHDDVLLPESQMWCAYMAHDLDGVVDAVARTARPALVAPTAYNRYGGYAARLNWVEGNREAARAGFQESRDHLAGLLEESPRDARLHAALCAVEAALGNRQASERARKRCMEVAEPDRYGDFQYYYKFFEAAVFLGDTDDALDRLDQLLSRPAEYVQPGYIKLDPMCDPLRDHPRFQQILSKHENDPF